MIDGTCDELRVLALVLFVPCGDFGGKLMAAVNPQPLQACPFEEHVRGPIPIEDDDGDYEDGGGSGVGSGDAMDDLEEANVNSVTVANHGGVVMTSRTSELTLSFEGEVYVFPAVTPEKVIILVH